MVRLTTIEILSAIKGEIYRVRSAILTKLFASILTMGVPTKIGVLPALNRKTNEVQLMISKKQLIYFSNMETAKGTRMDAK